MAIRTVFDDEYSERPQRLALSNVVRFLLVTGPLRWLIATHQVAGGEPARRTCAECDTRLWPSVGNPSGRCPFGHRVGAPPWLVEVLLLVSIALVVLLPGPRPAAAFWLGCAIVLGIIDGLVHRLPLALVSTMAGGTAALLTLDAALSGGWDDLIRAAFAGVALGGFFFLMCLPRNGFGLGDATLAVPIGLVLGWYGWSTVLVWALLASLLAGLVGIALLVLGKASRQTRIPLAPYMLIATVLAVAIS